MDEDASYLPPAEGFARLADTYDARLSGDPMLKHESRALLALVPSLEGKIVGDIGCGTGRYTLPLARTRAAEVIGIDLCAGMLARARRKAADAELPVKLARGDLLAALPLPDRYLDVSVCALTLSFVSDLPKAFVELARTLAPSGVLLVSELHPHGLCTARAESHAAFRKDHAPYLRFMDCDGAERRIAREPHLISHYLDAASAAGLVLERLIEPQHERSGVPMALALRFRAP
jgi:ubiquinone/menaquinone biosynthesis C-methylase UbiE